MGISRRMKHKTHLYTIFVKYLILFCLISLFVVGSLFTAFVVLDNMEVIYPANYIENQLEMVRETIQNTEEVTKDLIPSGCSYGIYHEDGTWKEGTFSRKEQAKAWKAYEDRKGQAGGGSGYKFYDREKELCVVRYPVKAVWQRTELNDTLPSPEAVCLLLAAAVFFTLNILLVRHYSRYLKGQLLILTGVARQIQDQDLEVQRGNSGVCEIDEVLESMDRMKRALKNSLEQQWLMEEHRKEQAAAIAHDIKTPLTVIRGNSELMAEAELLEEVQEYNDYIRQSVAEIEGYLKELQKMLRSEVQEELQIAAFQAAEFAGRIAQAAEGMVSQKNIRFRLADEMESCRMLGDEEALYRAVMNIVANAVDFTPEGGAVSLEMKPEGDMCRITVTDEGRGFTEEELRHATERFYQGEKSRSAAGHYGMGLSIAAAFMRQQNGALELANSEETGGGKVTLKIPVQR